MKKLISPFRLAMVMVVMVLVFAIYIVTLYDMQVIHGATWTHYAENHRLVGRTIEATRGRILDRNEVELVSNRSVNHIAIDWVTLANSPVNNNDTLLKLVAVTQNMGYIHTDTLGISAPPFEYLDSMGQTQINHMNAFISTHERAIRNMIRNMSAENFGLLAQEEDETPPAETPEPEELSIENVTAVQLMAFLRQHYNISAEYTAEETRIIAGVRFEIDIRNIIGMAEYYFVEDAGVALISAIVEHNIPGVFVQESSVRRYNTTVASHILGQVGPMTAEDVPLFPDYPSDAYIGRDGLERDFEAFLHGVNGRMVQTVTADGVALGSNIVREPQPGGNVISTLDTGLQAVAESALRSTIRSINQGRRPAQHSHAGAAVAIDPRNGEVLAVASVPGFSLENFNQQFTRLETDPTLPMFNRATGGTYEPGSAFKMVTALAALYEGRITEHTLFFCDGAFRQWEEEGFIYRCMGIHGNINLREAIAHSCNVYFYYLALWLGLDTMEEFAQKFGLGELTGIGFGEAPGQRSVEANMMDPSYNTVLHGHMIQVGIGQGASLFTPVQLANYAAMIASGGVRYRPQLLRQVRSYDGTMTIYSPEPEVLIDMRGINAEIDGQFRAIAEGMLLTSTHGTAASQLANFRVPVASKTGTVEIGTRRDANAPYSHGVFVAYAPFDDPQIAIAVVIEHGGAGSAVIPVAYQMLDHFFRADTVNQQMLFENVMLS